MTKPTKLELTWIGKENRPRLEPRILLEDQEKSYHSPHRVTDKDIFDNRLVFGDNLLALKALEQEFAGKIKCVFIDPPYNTGSAFTHYDDGLEHSIWLSLIRDRLELIHLLLSNDGSLWITIDDNEAHYLKVLCDEIFGRKNFVANVIWEKKYSPQNDAKWLSDSHDHILVYAKHKEIWRPNLLPRTEEMDKRYKNPDNDTRGPWKPGGLDVKTYSAIYDYPITTPSGRVVTPPGSSCWRLSRERFQEYLTDNRIWFGPGGNSVPAIKRFLSEVKQGTVSKTIWSYEEVGHNQDAKKEVLAFNSEDVFATPKPERLIQRILTLASNPGDWVLDSFAGSGPTGAVAHKMGRRWIMVELGEHCHTHIIPRMKKVIDGTDQGGISKLVPSSEGSGVGWKGGGGFRYFRLAPSLLEKDKWGNWVISKEYNATMLALAMAKHEGFVYNPDETFYWKQGKSTEKDYIFTTTNFITMEYLDSIHEEMQTDESLLICCKSFQEVCENRYENITVRKIPNMLLGRCEFGKEDYSLNVSSAPASDTGTIDDEPVAENAKGKAGKKKTPVQNQPSLFDNEGEDDNE